MTKSLIVSKHSPIIHHGFFVEDAKDFAQKHHDLFGSGPFVVLENTQADVTFRGEHSITDITIVTGWWKESAVEIIQQHSDNASYLNENGRYGFHHIDIFVEDVEAACKEFEAFGNSIQMYNFELEGFPFAYIDARDTLGFYIEVNQSMDFMSGLAKQLAVGWDGETDLFRPMEEVMKALNPQ